MINFRKLHKKTAVFLFLPLFLTAITGVAYRIGRSWFGMAEEPSEFFLFLHEGRFLGNALVPFYVLLTGMGLVFMIVTGILLIKRKKALNLAKQPGRWIHRSLSIAALVPLCVSSVTGIAYRLGHAWFNLSKEQSSFLLSLHQGSYLGQTLKPIYVLLVAAGLIGLLMTGIQMTGVFRRRKAIQTSDRESL